MSCKCQSILGLAAMTLALAAPAQSNLPVPVPARFSFTATNLMPPMPTVQSPVSFFRQLLMMSPGERNNSLASRPPEARARILAKVREYQALDPDERELRLRATELRWYLVPLLRMAPAERTGLLARVPPELLGIVKSRLMQWDVLPPPLHAEFLTNDQTLHYLTQTPSPSATNPPANTIAELFSQFFELRPREKQRLLGMLSETERLQMAKTLKAFDQLSGQQRAQCLRNYAEFAGMSSVERAEFLKNAESWSKMSPQERQTWRDLVRNMPLWPPGPSAILPPLPPNLRPKGVKPSMATN